MFAVKVREEMAQCFLELGQNDKAQKWMVEAQDIREKKNLGSNALFAGKVQGASGQRVIEGRIKEQEKQSKDSPEYWRKRAGYYRGRGETELEEEALKKGFFLTTPQTEPEKQSSERMQWRTWLLGDYANFLKRNNRIAEAAALARKEIEEMPADAWSVQRAVSILTGFDYGRYVKVNDELLWKWLTKRVKWSYRETGLIRRMLRKAKKRRIEQVLHTCRETRGR